MSTFYVLLDIGYTTSGHDGTSVDPWSFEQLQNEIYSPVSLANNDILKLRGKRTDVAVFANTSNVYNFQAWDVDVYGPWRLKFQYTYNNNMKDGIADFTSVDSRTSYYMIRNIENMYILGNESSNSYDGNLIKDSVIYPAFELKSSSSITATNSILINTFLFSAGNLSAVNILTNKTTSGALVTSGGSSSIFTNVTYNWIIPSNLPNINSPIELFDIDISGNKGPTWANNYQIDPYGGNRSNVGFFYFDYSPNRRGHIGAFYFGPIDEIIELSVLEISAVLLQPTVLTQNIVSSTVIPFVLNTYITLLQPTIYAIQDIEVDFVGVPRAGSSPLAVDFTAIVKLSPQNASLYKVKEYKWCFDYDYNNQTCKIPWVITTQNPITHVYTGYAGQKYSVKACVTLELI